MEDRERIRRRASIGDPVSIGHRDLADDHWSIEYLYWIRRRAWVDDRACIGHRVWIEDRAFNLEILAFYYRAFPIWWIYDGLRGMLIINSYYCSFAHTVNVISTIISIINSEVL